MDRGIRLPIGETDFRAIRNGGYYYVDKTGSVSTLIRDGGKSILFTRPRRFGKTTFQSMLSAFFDIREDSSDIFQGLAIMDDMEAVDKWMNRYPVIFLTFKDIDGLDFNAAIDKLRGKLSALYKGYSFISVPKSDEEGRIFNDISSGNCSLSEIRQSMEILARLLYLHYGKKVIILLDEYDVPLDKAERNGYYREMLDVMRSMLLSVLKDCPYTEKGILTGCLRISKESLFTGLNNLAVYSVTGKKYTDAFGFTEKEVSRLLADAELESKADIIREWYDGYSIGSEHIYTPWDVISYLNNLQADRNAKPENYWANSSGNEAIRRLIDMTDASVSDEYSTLINGGTIRKRIIETLTYSNLYSNEENIWSLFLMTGYLTLAGEYDPNGETELRLPNEEIRNLFASSVDEWFSDTVRESDRKALFRAIWEEDASSLSKEISSYLRQTISTYDFHENFYHAFLAGLLSGAGYTVRSNRESGEGRPDIILLDRKAGTAAVFELKRAESLDSMEASADEALCQLKDKEYGNDLVDYDRIIGFGISFYRKRALVRTADGLTLSRTFL